MARTAINSIIETSSEVLIGENNAEYPISTAGPGADGNGSQQSVNRRISAVVICSHFLPSDKTIPHGGEGQGGSDDKSSIEFRLALCPCSKF